MLGAPLEKSPSRLPTPLAIPAAQNLPPTRSLADVEKEHILQVLDLVQGNRSLAARMLQIGRNTLARKLKDYGL